MSSTGATAAALLAALLAGVAAWLAVPASVRVPRPVAAARATGAVRARRPERRGAVEAVRAGLRLLDRPADAEPPAVRVARAASEVAALLRAGATPAAAWAPQQLGSTGAGGMASGVVVGMASGGAVGGAGRPPDPVAAALDEAARAAAAGEDPAAALRRHRVGARRGATGAGTALASLALAWRTSEVTGAPAAAVLDGLAAALRDEAAATDARDASLAGPRATARLLLALPPLGLAASTALGADPVAVLAGTPAGRWCAALGLAFAVAGWAWTSALVRAAVRAR